MSQGNESARKAIEILRILSEYDSPVGSTLLKRELRKRGFSSQRKNSEIPPSVVGG
jgi:repressor of nif and glnA expression